MRGLTWSRAPKAPANDDILFLTFQGLGSRGEGALFPPHPHNILFILFSLRAGPRICSGPVGSPFRIQDSGLGLLAQAMLMTGQSRLRIQDSGLRSEIVEKLEPMNGSAGTFQCYGIKPFSVPDSELAGCVPYGCPGSGVWSHVHSGFRTQGWSHGHMAIQGSGLRVGPRLWLYTIQIYGRGFRVRTQGQGGSGLGAYPEGNAKNLRLYLYNISNK